ncbi:MAG: HAMP domain-containing sensor histidine kinase [bacterium]|nr:HAMP domain-containing sensor histidine kinase [bacterium]
MRRRLSVKLKLTLWFTCFMCLIAGVCLGLVLMVSGQVAKKEAYAILSLTVRDNLSEVALLDGKLHLSTEFSFYQNEVSCLIYNKDQALLSGQIPPAFPVDTTLENGVTKFVPAGSEGFYVLDFWIPNGWEEGVWLRGVLTNPGSSRMVHTIVTAFCWILPFFVLSASVGGYLVAKRTLAPISAITEMAERISEGKDLTRRIGLPEGKDEVSRLASAFDNMFARLEQAFEAEKQFTSDASHELRTPTAVILAQCAYAKKHADSLEEYGEAVEVIERQAGKMSQLIERLLDLTRMDLGTQKFHMERLDFSDMVCVLCEEQDTGARGISILTQIEEGVAIQADSFLISRVVLNLLENARKYGKENGTIAVRLFSENHNVILEVEDDGIGIEEEHLDKIWQRFYQVEKSRGENSGLGLGLSMVRQIVELHGGTISVKSVFGLGSCFTVIFPQMLIKEET